MIIGLDFDGTVCESAFPEVGPPVPNAIAWLHILADQGAKIMLWTCRGGEELAAAVAYLEANGLELWGVNENPDHKDSTLSNKAFADVYVDDRALGVPLQPSPTTGKAVVDWDAVGPMLAMMIGSKS